MPQLLILGRQPELSLAEAEAVYGAPALRQLSAQAVGILQNESIALERLGGALKVASLLGEARAADQLEQAIVSALLPLGRVSEGKFSFGLSFYGLRSSEYRNLGLSVKKRLREQGLSVRLVPNRGPELNAAQVSHNKLTHGSNAELLIVRGRSSYYIARTTAVQDIDSYTERDRAKPVRDPKVGMLPPKLAQIIINLAQPKPGAVILDPFCGTGTVLLEALLMGYPVIGTDLSPAMVEASQQNVTWLKSRHHITLPAHIDQGDARSYQWSSRIGAVAAETYLGPMFGTPPSGRQLQTTIREIDQLHRDFLKNLTKQLASGTRLCLAVPAWHVQGRFHHLPLIDEIAHFGYNRVSFTSVRLPLIYHRPGQVVARELLILTRK